MTNWHLIARDFASLGILFLRQNKEGSTGVYNGDVNSRNIMMLSGF